MNQYQNQYGTVYAVRDYKGAPQIMCRAKDDGDWLISGTFPAMPDAPAEGYRYRTCALPSKEQRTSSEVKGTWNRTLSSVKQALSGGCPADTRISCRSSKLPALEICRRWKDVSSGRSITGSQVSAQKPSGTGKNTGGSRVAAIQEDFSARRPSRSSSMTWAEPGTALWRKIAVLSLGIAIALNSAPGSSTVFRQALCR